METWLTEIPLEMDQVLAQCGGRRESPRHELMAEVEVLEPYRSVGVVLNVSAGGIRIAVDRPLFTDADCVIRVFAQGGSTRIEHARVVWTRKVSDGCVVGLRFIAAH